MKKKFTARSGAKLHLKKKSIERHYDKLHLVEKKYGKDSQEAEEIREQIRHIELMDEMFAAAI